MKDLFFWMVEHPDVKLEFERNKQPVYLIITMTYKGKTAERWATSRTFVKGIYEEERIINILNDLYKDCGGELFIDTLGLPTKIYNTLCRNNLMEYDDFDGLPVNNLIKIRGLGRTSIDKVLTSLKYKGFLLRNGSFVNAYESIEFLDTYASCTLSGGVAGFRAQVYY